MTMKGMFDGLPISEEKSFLKEDLLKIEKCWTAARFDSLPHVVHILTSKDREGEIQILKEQSDVIEEVVDEVVHAYHGGFNKAIQNYSQILRLFGESAESVAILKVDLAEAKKLLGCRNKQLHQLWYRSVTLRHIIALLDQIESIAKIPAQIEQFISAKQLYAAVQLHVQSSLMLEREGLQAVGALQDVRSELVKLRGVLFYKIMDDLHNHLYYKGMHSPSDGPDDAIETRDGVADSYLPSQRADNGGEQQGKMPELLPTWLLGSTPNEFVESMTKSDASLQVKYLATLVECLCMLGKIAAAGALLCQRLRPTVREVITSKIKFHGVDMNSSKNPVSRGNKDRSAVLQNSKGLLESYQVFKQKPKNCSVTSKLLSVSPVSQVMSPMGLAQDVAGELLNVILDAFVHILENHVHVGELLETKSTQQNDVSTPNLVGGDANWNPDSEGSQATGGYSVGFSLMVVQSECQQLICEILRSTPEAASADAAVQTARLASKAPSKDKRDGSEEGLSFAFRFTDSVASIPSQGWGRKGSNAHQEGYGTVSVFPEQGIYLAASIYRPVLQFTDKVASMLPQKYSQFGNDGLQAFVENFLKDHFLPTMFVDYRKCVQQAISSPAAFRPRAQASSTYTPSIEKGRPVLQGLLAIDFLAKEVLCWAQAMPKYAGEILEYVHTFLERAYERCRTSYTEAVLEKQSYMLIGRHDIESIMQNDPSSKLILEGNDADVEILDVEIKMSNILWNLQPIKQENLIRDDQKLILLASLSDSLEYIADSIERLGESSLKVSNHMKDNNVMPPENQHRPRSTLTKSIASLVDEYRRLAVDCLKVLRMEMLLETIFHMQEMTNQDYCEDQDAEEPDDFIISLTTQITRCDEEMTPFVAEVKRNYIFGGICGIAANVSIMALADMKSINLFGVQQICRNSIALEQALSAIPSISEETVQQRLDRVRTYYELLNLPFEALLAFITEHNDLFSASEYMNLLKVNVSGREIPLDAESRVLDLLPRQPF